MRKNKCETKSKNETRITSIKTARLLIQEYKQTLKLVCGNLSIEGLSLENIIYVQTKPKVFRLYLRMSKTRYKSVLYRATSLWNIFIHVPR